MIVKVGMCILTVFWIAWIAVYWKWEMKFTKGFWERATLGYFMGVGFVLGLLVITTIWGFFR